MYSFFSVIVWMIHQPTTKCRTMGGRGETKAEKGEEEGAVFFFFSSVNAVALCNNSGHEVLSLLLVSLFLPPKISERFFTTVLDK